MSINHNSPTKLQPHCADCGSTNVFATEGDVWDYAKQIWVVNPDVGHRVDCLDCDCVGEPEWRATLEESSSLDQIGDLSNNPRSNLL